MNTKLVKIRICEQDKVLQTILDIKNTKADKQVAFINNLWHIELQILFH